MILPWQDAAAEKLVKVRSIKNRPDLAAVFRAALIEADPDIQRFYREFFEEKDIPIERDASYAEVDINGDGVKELFVQMDDISWCGSAGCTTFVYQRTGRSWKEICRFIGYPPYRLVDIWDHGYRRMIGTGRDTMVRWAEDGTCR